MSYQPPGGQPPYFPPAPLQPPAKAPPAHDGLAITSLILSILWFFGLGSVLAVIFGHRSRGESKRNGRATSALATAGVVIGYIGIAGALLSIAVIAAGVSTSTSNNLGAGSQPVVSTVGPATSSAPAPAPTANPDGTYAGACDYTLGSNPVGGTAFATGDIEVHNTGNIGTVIKLRITWPQQGFSPLVKTTTIRLAAGASRDVQFRHRMTGTEVDNLQNWQSGYNYRDGCTYKSTITNTFGNPS